MENNFDTKADLLAVRKLLELPSDWTKYRLAATYENMVISPLALPCLIRCRCITGAYYSVSGNYPSTPRSARRAVSFRLALLRAVPATFPLLTARVRLIEANAILIAEHDVLVQYVNDASHTSHADILRWIDKAVELLA